MATFEVVLNIFALRYPVVAYELFHAEAVRKEIEASTTVCTAPKYGFFKHLYLNNYKSYLYKFLNIAY